MARAYGTRPSSILAVDDPLVAYQFDAAVFALDEAIDAAVERERRRHHFRDLDTKTRREALRDERDLQKVLERALGIADEKRVAAAVQAKRPVEYLFDETGTDVVGWRYADEAPVDG